MITFQLQALIGNNQTQFCSFGASDAKKITSIILLLSKKIHIKQKLNNRLSKGEEMKFLTLVLLFKRLSLAKKEIKTWVA